MTTEQLLADYLAEIDVTLDVSAGVYRRQVFDYGGRNLFPRVLDWEYVIWADEELEA